MGKLLEKLFSQTNEDGSNKFNIRIKPNTNAEDGLNVVKDKDSLTSKILGDIETGSSISLSDLNAFRTLSSERDMQYNVYDEMREDSIISAALEMYADDATQYNRDGSVIWVDSDDENCAKFYNRLIQNLDLNKNSWSYIYALCLYGEIYLETFTDDPHENTDHRITNVGGGNVYVTPKGFTLEEYVEMYADPCELYDLTEKGKTVGFVRVPVDSQYDNNIGSPMFSNLQLETRETLYDPKKFVHICLCDEIDRHPETLTLQLSDDSKTVTANATNTVTFKVKRGKSILHDIYKIYQELKLLEDALLLNRITRSSIIRLLQVEVGDSTKNQIQLILKRLKNMIEQKTLMNKNEGKYKSQANPGPVENIIYMPTRNGKGAVSMSNIGGDVDIKSIVDIDYFKNKFYGGLKIPKQYLGDDDNGSALSNGTSLTKLDARYARTIKRIQNAYIQGITDLLNLYALSKHRTEYINNFTVKMVSPSTTEDSERDEQMGSRMDLIGSFIELLGDNYSDKTIKEVFEYFVDYYLSDNELSAILKKDKGVPDEEESTEDEDDSDNFEGGFSDGGDFGSDDFDDSGFDNDDVDDSGFDSDSENGDDLGFENESESEENAEDFGDFEDEY